jgi:glycosyltransferase involved in cell wall biosynthesis
VARVLAVPTVSVIVVTRDRPAFLADALAGVAAQAKSALEVRVGDDGGGSSVAVVESIPLLEVTLLPLSIGQAGAARNAAAAGARGEVLAFLDDDDLWKPDHLAGLSQAFADPGVGLAWRDCDVVRERVSGEGVRVALERRRIARDWDDAIMRRDDYVPPSSFALRRALFEMLGGFDPSFRFSEDWDLLLRAAATAGVRRVPGVTVEVRLRDASSEPAHANTSSEFGPERLACLEQLAARHGFATPAPKTFWEVAQELGEPAA